MLIQERCERCQRLLPLTSLGWDTKLYGGATVVLCTGCRGDWYSHISYSIMWQQLLHFEDRRRCLEVRAALGKPPTEDQVADLATETSRFRRELYEAFQVWCAHGSQQPGAIS